MELTGSRLVLGEKLLKISDAFAFLKSNPFVGISDTALSRVKECRDFLEEELKKDKAIYGVNTGFGKFAKERITGDMVEKLQLNLIRSHASGVGEPLQTSAVCLAMLILLNGIVRARSGVRPETAEFLAKVINLDFIPVVPSIGSLGASGDLAPLASIALALIGEGEVFTRGEAPIYSGESQGFERLPAMEALNRLGLSPLSLKEKEGLALINSTAVSQAMLILALKNFTSLFPALLVASALSHEAYGAADTHFNNLLYQEKPHGFSQEIADVMRKLTFESELRKSHLHCDKVQDPYSFRCFVITCESLLSAFSHLAEVLSVEMNSSTDNPLIFYKDELIVSGGNFHGEQLAVSAETCALALARSAMMSERRVNQLLHPGLDSNLPPFLALQGGIESGLMLLQYVDASLIAEINHLASPAILTNVSVSGDQEDFVSMSFTSAKKLLKATELFAKVIAIEVTVAIKGVKTKSALIAEEYHLATSDALTKAISNITSSVELPEGDSSYTGIIEKLSELLLQDFLGGKFLGEVNIEISSLLPWIR